MRLKRYFVCLFLVTAIAALLVETNQPSKFHGQATLPNVRSAASFSAGKCRGRWIAFAIGVRCRSGTALHLFSSDDDRSQSRAGRTARKIYCPRPRHHSTHDHRRNRSGVGSAQKGTAGRRGEAQIRRRIGGRQANLPVRRIHGRKKQNGLVVLRPSAGPRRHSRRRRKTAGRREPLVTGEPGRKAARPRIRRKHAAGDSAPTQKQVPHQTAPTILPRLVTRNPPSGDAGGLQWQGDGRLAAETNYFMGNDPAKWRTHVQHFRE